MPTMAIGASVSSMAAQNVGARRWDRVEQVARAGVISGLVITGAVALLLYAFNAEVLGVLLPARSPAIALAAHINQTVLWGFVLFSVTFSLSGVVRSTGAVWWPLAIMIVSMIGVRIPFASYFSQTWGADAIWWSFPLGTITSAVLTTLYYRFGGWRRVHMLEEAPADSDSIDAVAESEAAAAKS